MAQNPNAVGWAAYDSSTVAKGTGYSSYESPSFGHSEGSSSGSYSPEIAMALLFFDEIRRMSGMIDVPTFDMGVITEVLGKGKFKIKLQCLNTIVTATSGIIGTGMYSSSGTSAGYKKGYLALVLMTNSDPSSPNGVISYSIITAKSMGVNYNLDENVYPV